MIVWYNNILDNMRYMVDVSGNRVRIGRNPDNEWYSTARSWPARPSCCTAEAAPGKWSRRWG